MAVPFKVKAVFDYASEHDDDLKFSLGDIITVTEVEDDDWYVGNYTDANGATHQGLFPRNFVEKYEPQAPPRPTRTRPAAAPAIPEPTPTPRDPEPAPRAADKPAEIPAAQQQEDPSVQPVVQKTEDRIAEKKVPPPTASKPSANSFKDRIAAFNKGNAAPVAPVGRGPPAASSTFIKKRFVAPPPARDAYVPPPKSDAPAKVYRRDEDPEIQERQQQHQEEAERAGLAVSEDPTENTGEAEEDAPKTTSLKDRIALLRKQQEEAASRRADMSQREKPAKPTPRQTLEPEEAESLPRLSGEQVRDNKPPLTRKVSKEPRASVDSIRGGVSDGNEADQSGAGETTEDGADEDTEVEDTSAKPDPQLAPHPPTSLHTAEETRAESDRDDDVEDATEETEETEEQAEARRKEELRARMAKMSGGMGMPGMFGPSGGMGLPPRAPPKPKSSTQDSSSSRAAPVAIPGMGGAPPVPSRAPEVSKEPEPLVAPSLTEGPAEIVPDVEDVASRPQGLTASEDGRMNLQRHKERAAPPVPGQSRPPPPPAPGTRPIPPLPSRDAVDEEEEDREEDDEDQETEGPVTTTQRKRTSTVIPAVSDLHTRGPPPPVPGAAPLPPPRAPSSSRQSTLPPPVPTSPPVGSTTTEKRASRAPPPVPIGSPQMLPHGDMRAPPPPPPPAAAPPSTRQTEDEEDGESEYEGDYDTDIASGATHKLALNANPRTSVDESTLSEDPASPVLPKASIPREAPPPPPPASLPPRISRQSTETGRPLMSATVRSPDEYDPYRYSGTSTREDGAPPLPPSKAPQSPPLPPTHQTLQQSLHPSAPSTQSAESSRKSRDLSRPSMETGRSSVTVPRRSVDMSRPSLDNNDFIASDVDLAEPSKWWSAPQTPPPSLQNRTDVLCEYEESSASKRGGRTTITRDVYVLYHDYSQTTISAQFDSRDISSVTFEQRHQPPPARLRQDQLEQAYGRYGPAIAKSSAAAVNTVVGDGSALAFVTALFEEQANTLKPVGTRSFGALVYANLANASVQQYDEIRPGDIVSFRNAKFSGKHGAMHAKYSEDVGKPDHVAVVGEWDGTRKKVRAYEQGRDADGGSASSKQKLSKVKLESFKLGDLRSGEVKVWRVMGRDWINWE